jgi:hypothetical protein
LGSRDEATMSEHHIPGLINQDGNKEAKRRDTGFEAMKLFPGVLSGVTRV